MSRHFARAILCSRRPLLGTCRGWHSHRPVPSCRLLQHDRTFKFTTTRAFATNSSDVDSEELFEQNILKDVLFYNKNVGQYHKDVVVIMPRQKGHGPLSKTHDKGQFLLEETVTLTETVSGWKVVGSHMISSPSVRSKTIFGSTNLEHIKEYVGSVNANAVVFAIDYLTPSQHHFFSEFLNIDVYDRFSLVLQIFQMRAATKEAKLQLALAELGYVKRNLHHMKECNFSEFTMSNSFGNFDTYFQQKKQLIQEREIKLKKMLQDMEKNNLLKKQQRVKAQVPTVAVVGYTNSGKTSLIKALTHDSRLVPEDKLFATLDVSAHKARLPSNLEVFLVDTIGFITEIPTALMHSFKSTLSEIAAADLIVHILDSSHPDMQLQSETVHKTLREIDVPDKLFDTMIEVANKVDKIEPEKQQELSQDNLLISATERIGLDELKRKIEEGVVANTDRLMLKLRVPNGGEHYQWLYREVTVIECIEDSDPNYLVMKVIITKTNMGKFMKQFGKSLTRDL